MSFHPPQVMPGSFQRGAAALKPSVILLICSDLWGRTLFDFALKILILPVQFLFNQVQRAKESVCGNHRTKEDNPKHIPSKHMPP